MRVTTQSKVKDSITKHTTVFSDEKISARKDGGVGLGIFNLVAECCDLGEDEVGCFILGILFVCFF